jgi:hypothetical protein
MYPPIYAICAASTGVKATFADPPRVYPFGVAKQGETLPYAVQQTISGSPDNALSGVPVSDAWDVQIDVYADTVDSATSGAQALRDAFEAAGVYIIRWGGVSRDPDTDHYRYSFDVSAITSR